MLKKALITSTLLLAALASNGARPASAVSFLTQDSRPLPLVPSTLDSSAVPGDPGEEFREEFHQTYPLSATGRVGLENINGGVQIKVWDRAAVQVDALKKANRKERLAEVKIEVNSTEDNLSIKTEYPDWNQTFRGNGYDNPATVEYTLTVPRKAALESIELVNGSLDIDGAEGSVKASSINGRVTATNLLADVKLSTINGQLKAMFTKLDEANPIELGSVNGSVTLIIPSDTNASVRAGTVHGGISNDFGLVVKHGEYVGHSLDGQIGAGGPKIKLANVNGGITITHAQDGRTVSPAVSLGGDKQKDKDKDKDDDSEAMEADIQRTVEQATATATSVKIQLKMEKVAREAQIEAQRQVDIAIRDAQRDIERAQVEVQRDNARQIRDQVRMNRGRGAGSGSGSGTGGGDNRATSQESKTFTVSGSPRVNVSTFDGSVQVHGWDKSEVMYTATTRGDEEEDLKKVAIQTEQTGSSISFVATTDNDRSASVQFEVWVPRQSSIHVSSDDGSLKLDGVSGDITLRTGDGSIEVNDGGGVLQLNTGDGHIQVVKFDGQLDARTGDGSIRLDGNFNALSARTGDGSISLTVPSSSNFTVETNAEGDVTNEGLSLSEDIAPSKRVKRWRVGSGGKVFVLNTGDGRITLRSR